MVKTKIMIRQANLKNETELVVCPCTNDGRIHKPQPAFACPLVCSRHAGRDSEYIVCGNKGTNKDMLKTPYERTHPALWEIFGAGERAWMVGAYGIPQSTKTGY